MAKPKSKRMKKSFVEILQEEIVLNSSRESGQWTKLPNELQQLIRNWESLPLHIQDVMLILGRVRRISRVAKKGHIRTEPIAGRQKHGETPQWRLMAVEIVKNATEYMTDREISLRVGVHPSTLCRDESYINAKRTYMQPFATIGRRGLRAE